MNDMIFMYFSYAMKKKCCWAVDVVRANRSIDDIAKMLSIFFFQFQMFQQ